jgi:hypothetical protein
VIELQLEKAGVVGFASERKPEVTSAQAATSARIKLTAV